MRGAVFLYLAVSLSVCIAFLMVTLNAYAEGDYSIRYDTCMQESGGVTASMRECTSDELSKQDKLLNERYRARMSSLGGEEQQKLRTAQRAWVAFRDANCSFLLAEEGGGTLGLIIADTCMLEMTARRAKELSVHTQKKQVTDNILSSDLQIFAKSREAMAAISLAMSSLPDCESVTYSTLNEGVGDAEYIDLHIGCNFAYENEAGESGAVLRFRDWGRGRISFQSVEYAG